MSRGVIRRRTPALVSGAIVVASIPVAFGVSTAHSAPGSGPDRHLYIVQVAGAPVASYDGGVTGLRQTSPPEGEDLDAHSPEALAYRGYLRQKQRSTLARADIPAARQQSSYSVAFNGYAARLTTGEAHALERTKGVLRVWKNEIVHIDTTDTPRFLGLEGRRGLWKREFGGAPDAGRGVVVGVIDTGFWPESASFAPLSRDRRDDRAVAERFHGICQAGVEAKVTCNNKVIGARYYNGSGEATEGEFLSPRDFNGHGSHTASTAAGNNGVPASIDEKPVGEVSGMAPGARLSVYKALWQDFATGTATGGTADLVNAIDDAVSDGVDVINYSISGSSQFVVDPVEIAFLQAAEAGVFVATSAGNAGDTVGESSVAHNSPWLTTVAASTHDRGVSKTLTLGNGDTFDGVGVGSAVGAADLVDSVDAVRPGAPAAAAELCFSDADNDPSTGVDPVLDPATVTGKIVLCARGVSDRLDKSVAVENAGGIGMVLYNPTPNSLNADFHAVPSIHVDDAAGAAVKSYAATASPTASISAVLPDRPRAPEMAGFSSFGPALAGDGDLLKPDITAPGVDVIAAVAPPGNRGNSFQSASGTSMSSPHIAGIAALLKSSNPDWAPMWIKSALMTGATPKDNTGQEIQRSGRDATPLDFGSGHVRPESAFDPGLVYDSGMEDWLQYGCGIDQLQLVTPPGFCEDVGSIDPSDLNYPTIGVGDLAGSQTVTRTVTNVDRWRGRYRVSVEAPEGIDVTVSAARVTVPGRSEWSFEVTLTRTTAPLDEWAFGSLTLTDRRGHEVRSVIAVRPVALANPEEVTFTGAEGTGGIDVTPGYTGTLGASVEGLVPATVTPLPLDAAGPAFDPGAPAKSTRTGVVPFTVAADTAVVRVATFDADYPPGTDADIWVYRVEGSDRTPVDLSAAGTAEESVTLFEPEPGRYEAYIDLFGTGDPASSTLTVRPNSWLVHNTPEGNATVTPASQQVTSAQSTSVDVSRSGLTAGARYLGTVRFDDGADPIGRTLVSVN